MSELRVFLESVRLNEVRFLSLLEHLVGESKNLQNNPAQGLIPREDLASDHVLRVLAPFRVENGGVLRIERISFVEGRGNLIITYPGTGEKVCSFVGSHFDVVPASPEGWSKDPFKLIVEGDKLFGRGTTDCLGHVALLTDLMATLAEKRPTFKNSIVCVFIANEENGAFKGVGVDQLALEGHMDHLKRGPLFWVDSADSQPCIGTCGNLQWKLTCIGKLFHSGLPHKGINAIELAMDAVEYLQKKFFKDFPRHPNEDVYAFATQSTFKPTQFNTVPGALNQLPWKCIVEGDCRLAPFYDVAEVEVKLVEYVAELNANPAVLENPDVHGPHSKYTLPDEDFKASLELTFLKGENGVACDINSPGHLALKNATSAVIGEAFPYAIGGSLPLIRELQDNGFDVQIAGYGLSSKYHADNECASLNGYRQATQIFAKIIASLEELA